MTCEVTLLAGLPAYGPMATPFPTEWGRRGGEGVVVEFKTPSDTWTGNFRRGMHGIDLADLHPNQRDAVVVAGGDLWIVNPNDRIASHLPIGIDAAIKVTAPNGWIFSRQGLALFRLGPQGIVWHTKRISWDGFDELKIVGERLTGLAAEPSADGPRWHPFEVEIRSGRSTGGTAIACPTDDWEQLADE